MRKRIIICLVVLAFMVAVAYGAFAKVEENVKYDTEWMAYIPCSGDLVYLTGPMHILISYNEDEAGGVHSKVMFQPQNLQGQVIAGPNLGAQYNGNGVTQEKFNGKKGMTYSFLNNYLIIGQGGAPNFMVHETWHITINANGEVTAVVDNRETSCK